MLKILYIAFKEWQLLLFSLVQCCNSQSAASLYFAHVSLKHIFYLTVNVTKFSILFSTFLQVTCKSTVSVKFISCFNKIPDKGFMGFSSLKNNIKRPKKKKKSHFMFRSEKKK